MKFVRPRTGCDKLNLVQNKPYLLISFESPGKAKHPSGVKLCTSNSHNHTTTAAKSVSFFLPLSSQYFHFDRAPNTNARSAIV